MDRREAHRLGLCVDCKRVRHSPGRTRCDDCHIVYMQPPAPPPFVIELTLLPDRASQPNGAP